MPVIFSRNVLCPIVGVFQFVRFTELRDGFLDASGASQFMPAHVMGMRNGGGKAQGRSTVFERLFRLPDVFKRMSQIMMRGGFVRRNGKRGWVERDGIDIAGR